MTVPPLPPPPQLGPNKAIAAVVAGATVAICAWAVSYFTKIVVPPGMWETVQTLIVTVLVYYVPHNAG